MEEIDKRRIKITGTGFYAPDRVISNADLEKMVDTTDEWITSRTGIKERRMAAPEQATSDLTVEAAKKAMKDADVGIDDIDVIIVATATPDTLFPSTACWAQKKLNANHIPALDISAACTGFIYGMILAESLILSGKNKRILLIGAECLSRIIDFTDRNTCVLFGDGAGAVVLEESSDDSGMLSSYWKSDGNLADLLLVPGGGARRPISQELVDSGEHYLTMHGNDVFKHAVKRMGEAALAAAEKAGLSKDDIDILIPHQANIRIINATGRRLKLPPEKVFVNIQKYGNVSAATIPICLDELKQAGTLKKGDNIVMVSFGAGFTWGSIAYRCKVVFLNFWATWCGPCRQEVPAFIEAYEKFKDQGMEILGVSLDQGGPSVVKKFAAKYKINYPLAMWTTQIIQDYQPCDYIPSTIFIDSQGRIQGKHIGPLTKSDLEKKFLELSSPSETARH